MDPTSLPTDNLYKFMALGGLFLTGFGGWLFWKLRVEERNKVTLWEESNVRNEVQLDLADKREMTLLRRKGAIEVAFTTERDPDKKARLQKALEAAEDKLAKHLEKTSKHKEQFKLWTNQFNRLFRNRLLDVVLALCCVAMVVGLACAGIGFSSWQSRLQNYADEQVQVELDLKRVELKQKQLELTEKQAPKSASPATSASAQPTTVVINNPASPSVAAPPLPATAATPAPP
jgi:hypothetical protein